MSGHDITNGDCIRELKYYNDNVFDTCITDPPYELGMDSWDKTGISYQPNTWRSILRVMKPGAFLLAFGGSRTYHRIAVAIEDAGFQLRDTIYWVFGSGFPKSTNVSKAISKAGLPSSFAELWDGWYTSLKPAVEPIIVAMKPLDGTYVRNAIEWGVAGLNIDRSRVPTDEVITINRFDDGMKPFGKAVGSAYTSVENTAGRYPANLIWDGSDEVAEEFVKFETSDGGNPSRFFYSAKVSKREKNLGLPVGMTNDHKTVKPVELMRYLVRLTKTPYGGIVLDPFMGTGTTGIASKLEEREFVGIELDASSFQVALERINNYELYK